MNNTILEVKDLTVTLDNERVINNLSFSVAAGEILTILGPNGAGKSVLVKTLLGLIPYTGQIVWNQKPKIGYLPQGLSQLRAKNYSLTIRDLFELKNPRPTQAEMRQYLDLVGLEGEVMNKVAGKLSGGQFQRLLIAWVLISHPQILFLDEPTAGVAIGGEERIYELIRDIWKKEKLTIFLVTHDLNIVFKYSTNVLCLSRKTHPCFGPPKDILSPQLLAQTFGMEIKFYEHR